jgi:hypothetical protein
MPQLRRRDVSAETSTGSYQSTRHRPRRNRRASHVIPIVILLTGCAAVPDRPARSTVGCAEAVVAQHVPTGIPDKLAHCLAGGLIARYCSAAEAEMAAVGKEVRDAFTGGDVEWADWRAAHSGVRCAHGGADASAISSCCSDAYGGATSR